LGQTRADLGTTEIKKILQETADAISDISKDVAKYFKQKSKHPHIGEKIVFAWGDGVRQSLALGAAR
jgi:hypothetical protein